MLQIASPGPAGASEREPRTRAEHSDRQRRLDRWGLALLVALFCALGVVYSLSVPLLEAPDEIWHFNFIRVLATERALPQQPTGSKDMWLREAGQPPIYHLLSALVIAPLDTSDFPGWVRFNVAHPAVTNDSQNEAPNVFIHTEAEAWPFRGSVLAVYLARWSTLLWGAGAVVGTVLVARRVLPNRPGLALAAGALAALTPHFLFISSVINNDAAAACLCTLTLWACIRLVQDAKPGLSLRGRTLAKAIPTSVHRRTWPNAALLGLLLGLSLLSKMSALALLPLVALALGLAWWNERDRGARAVGALLLRAAAVFGPAALVSGWWFVRNWILYGDPLGWSVWLIDIGVQRIGLAELIRQFGHVATSYISPYDGLLPKPVFWALGVGLAVAVAGWIVYLACLWKARPPLSPPRQDHGGEEHALPQDYEGEEHALPRQDHEGEKEHALPRQGYEGEKEHALPRQDYEGEKEEAPAWARASSPSPSDRFGRPGEGRGGGLLPVDHQGLLLAGTWLVLLVASLVRYMTTTPSAEGRLLYPGIASASLLLALGWAILLPRRWSRPVAGIALLALLGLNLATPLAAIAPRFARPLVTRAQELKGLEPFVGGDWGEVRLLGARIVPETVLPGERVDVTLYWEAITAPSTDLRAIVRLRGAGGRLLAQWDEPPANERYPSDLWRAGDVVRDEYALPSLEGGPAIYQVSVTLLRGQETEQDAEPLARTAHRFKLAPGGFESDPVGFVRQQYTLGERVRLYGCRLPKGETPHGGSLPLVLYWEALAEMEQEYSVFVHLVASDGTLIGQGDGPPLNGDYPTTGWAAGERLADPHIVRLELNEMEQVPPGSYLLVGLYRLEDGVRLAVVDGDGARVPQDAVRIELRGD